MRLTSISAALATLAVVSLCQCSFLFDAGSLDNPSAAGLEGGPPAADDGGAGDDTSGDSTLGDDGPSGTMPDSPGGGDDGGPGADTGSDGSGGSDAADSGQGGGDGGQGGKDGGDGGVVTEGGPFEAGNEGGAEGGGMEAGPTDASDGGGVDLTFGLVAYYMFNESSGTTTADSSGNGNTATVVGGATFTAGLQGNAITLSGSSQYVTMPSGILAGLNAVSISAWFNLTAADLTSTKRWIRVFDFGVPPDGGGPTTYMFLSPNAGTGTTGVLRFAITTGGNGQEQQLQGVEPPAATWQHVVVTMGAGSGTLYVGGIQTTTSTVVTLTPAGLGTTTQNWIGRSQFSADPYLIGQVDNFRIYNRVLTATEVAQLFSQQL